MHHLTSRLINICGKEFHGLNWIDIDKELVVYLASRAEFLKAELERYGYSNTAKIAMIDTAFELEPSGEKKSDPYTNDGMFKRGVDPKVTCWHCKSTHLCDCCDATCWKCRAPYAKERCAEFGFIPTTIPDKPQKKKPREWLEERAEEIRKQEPFFTNNDAYLQAVIDYFDEIQSNEKNTHI